MKKTIIFAAFALATLASFGQKDTSTVTIIGHSDGVPVEGNNADTIQIGSMTIIKKGNFPNDHSKSMAWKHKGKNNRKQTSWLLLDFGFSNFTDKTSYGSADALAYTGNVHFNESDFNLKNGKSFNINVWIFRQQYGLTKNNVLNLTYGLMIENNNYRFENNISFRNYGNRQFVAHDSIHFSKNKLATSYFTLPVMIGFNTNPQSRHGFNASAGVSFGYLYSSRNKQVSKERNKQKVNSNFNMEPWKIQLIGEAGIGSLKVFGSYAPKSMFKTGLDFRPYNIGLRLGGWN